MGAKPPNFIEELDFVLTHPKCNVKVLERYYNSWLYMFESVPLFAIVDHMRKATPKLLNEWAKENKTVRSLLIEIDPTRDDKGGAAKRTITVHVDLSNITPEMNEIYRVSWETELDEPIVNAHFKTKSLLVIDRNDGNVNLVGISNLGANRYHLYVKKRRKTG
ncbi:hypothetical protein ACLBWT_18635 [Paenibacillus sp. D51F]